MRKFALFVLLLLFSKVVAQDVPVGYDYIGRSTFHIGLSKGVPISKEKNLGLLLTTGVHLTGYEGSTRGIFEATGAITRQTVFVGATYTPYAVIPKMGIGKKDAYAYIGYVFPTQADSPLNKGIAVGVM